MSTAARELLRVANVSERTMSVTSQIRAFFRKPPAAPAPPRKHKRPRAQKQRMADAHVKHVANVKRPVTWSGLEPPGTARLEDIPDDLPTVAAPPAGTPAREEPNTGGGRWFDGSWVSMPPSCCQVLCCSFDE